MHAWEVTDEDIATVLESHGSSLDADAIHQQSFIGNEPNIARVVKAALAYTEFDDQVTSALDEIEDILFEQGVLNSEKVFSAP